MRFSGDISPKGKGGWSVMLTTFLHLVTRLDKRLATTFPRVLMAYRGQFYISFSSYRRLVYWIVFKITARNSKTQYWSDSLYEIWIHADIYYCSVVRAVTYEYMLFDFVPSFQISSKLENTTRNYVPNILPLFLSHYLLWIFTVDSKLDGFKELLIFGNMKKVTRWQIMRVQ
jgi:hypothetical protein